jgi:SAM-dependent methyltransferase
MLDVGGGTGLYSLALLQKHPGLRAVVLDRPEVLRVTRELAVERDVGDRLECIPGDMFVDALPGADLILLSNVLHDWDVPECRRLVDRCAAVLPPAGKLVVHDVFLHDDLGGPLAVALDSATLFSVTEGRAYSVAECAAWLREAGLAVGDPMPTLAHASLLVGSKPAQAPPVLAATPRIP